MLFNSFEFALFLPVVFLLYWFVFSRSLRAQNLFVVGASYLFYGWWDWRFLLLIAFTSLCSYASGLLIGRFRKRRGGERWSRAVNAGNILLNLTILGVFKYYDFFAASFAELFGIADYDSLLLRIILPVGISFYTFQALSYSIDVYREKLAPTRDIVAFFAFISFFPQLVAGPIERATNLLPQFLRPRTFDTAQAVDGLRQALWGFFKKIVVADNCAILANGIFDNYENLSGGALVIGAVAFSFQIYGDFSGYSDIAIGISRLFGFSLMRNFNYPYFSRDIAEFWRRWHISLSSWVRDYLFLPLSSFTRRWGQWGVAASLMVTFIALGVWHGAGWTFAVYGFIQGLVIVWELRTERIRNKVRKHIGGRLFAMLSVIRTYLIFAVSLVFFKAKSVSDAFYFLRNISFQTHASWKEINIGMSDHICIVAGAALLLMLLYDFFMSKGDLHRRLERQPILLRWTIYYLIVFALFAYGKFGTENFIYLQF